MIDRLASYCVAVAYLSTIFNSIAYPGFFVLYLAGLVSAPISEYGYGTLSLWELAGLSLCAFLGWFGLYCRYEFDLLRGCDGTSAPSRFIWTALVLMYNASFIHVFFNEMVDWY